MTGAAILAFLQKWWPVIVAPLIFGAIILLAYCNGQSAGKSGQVVKDQQGQIQLQNEVSAADTNAAAARVSDATNAVQQQQELNNAVNSTNSADLQRIRLGCVILRQQGTNTSNISACR